MGVSHLPSDSNAHGRNCSLWQLLVEMTAMVSVDGNTSLQILYNLRDEPQTGWQY
jgi:hypothetical protein